MSNFKEVSSLDADITTALGGINKKTGKPNPTTMTGYFIGSREVDSKMSKTGKAAIHVLQTPQGNVGVWGKTDLDRKLSQVTPGSMIRITQNGKQEIPGKNPMYKFKVEVDSSDTIEVSLPQEEAPNAEFDAPFGTDQAGDGVPYYDHGDDLTDEVEPVRPVAPARAAQVPTSAQQQKVKDLLAKSRNKTS